MRKGVYLAVVFASLWAAAAPAATALGSVITSFRLSGFGEPFATGLYAGRSYICAVFFTSGSDYIYWYARTGSFVASFTMTGCALPAGGDASHLGADYMSVVDSTLNRVFIYGSGGGAPVSSFAVTSPAGGLRDLMWTGTYYEIAGNNGTGQFNRYTSAGSYAGQVTYAGWPSVMTGTGAVAYSAVADGASGRYLIANPRIFNQPSCILDIRGAGSLVATFAMPQLYAYGGCAGASSDPSRYGTTEWLVWLIPANIYCFEVDIGGKILSNVFPASLGKIKAVYR